MVACSEENHGSGDEYNPTRFYGKYRARVISNIDPLGQGRIQVMVPSVSQFNVGSWAKPSPPFEGPGCGFFFVPHIGAKVWIEFEEGDPDYPILAGGFWDEIDIAAVPPTSKPFLKPGDAMIRTLTGTSIIFNDAPIPGVTIQTIDGKKIIVNSAGIEIGIGTPEKGPVVAGIKIDLSGNITVSTLSPRGISITAPKVSINSP
jgi:hypothetical protein